MTSPPERRQGRVFETAHGLAGPSSLAGTHDLRSPTVLSSSRTDPLRKEFEKSQERSFSKHVEGVQKVYDAHSSQDTMGMIRAKMAAEGYERDAVEARGGGETRSSLYDESTSDVQKMIRAKIKKEALESESTEGEGGSDSQSEG